MKSAVEIGAAAESFVSFKLRSFGIGVHAAAPGSPYDLIAEGKNCLLKIQVKGTKKPREGRYHFTTSKGRGHKNRYVADDVDIFAFVALDIEKVYLAPFATITGKTLKLALKKFHCFDEKKEWFKNCHGLKR